MPGNEVQEAFTDFRAQLLRNFAFAAHVEPVTPGLSLFVGQKGTFNNTLAVSDCEGQHLVKLRVPGTSEHFQRSHRICGYDALRVATENVTRLWTRKFFSFLLIDCSMV
jgi:hypothetical protein